VFRCKHCEEELEHVLINWSGYERRRTTGWAAHELEDAGGVLDVSITYDEVMHDEDADAEYEDGDSMQNIESYECPECAMTSNYLSDLVELVADEEEEDEESPGVAKSESDELDALVASLDE
jgi:hypothetical protein